MNLHRDVEAVRRTSSGKVAERDLMKGERSEVSAEEAFAAAIGAADEGLFVFRDMRAR